MTCQRVIKLVWSEWFNSTSSASTVSWEFILLSAQKFIVFSARSFSSSASSVQETREFVQLSARKLTVSLVWSSSRSSTSSSASSFLRSSSAWDLQRFFTQIASLFSISSIFTSVSVSFARLSAWDARNLRRKLKQRFSVSSSRFSSHIYFSYDSSHDSSRSSSCYSSARNSCRTLTWNVSVFSSRSFAWIFSCDSFTFSFSILSSHDSSARTLSSDSLWSSSRDSFIKSCLFMKNLYVMFHRLSELSEKKHTLQSQRQRVFLKLTYSISFSIFVSSSCSLKRFLQRSKMKLSFWIQ